MPLLIPYDASGLDGKLRTVLDDIVARVQIWAGGIEGINAAQRLNELTEGISTLPTVLTGTVHAYTGSSAPTGYLMCDGSAVSRETYANLFVVMGTTYGAGNGTTTFNVPDLRQRVPLGKAASGTGSTLGSTGGAINHTHSGGTVSGSTASESSHTHGAGSFAAAAGGDHNHGGTTGIGDTTQNFNMAAGATAMNDAAHVHDILDSGTHTHTISGTSAAGSSHSHSAGTLAVGTSGTANPPFQVVNYIVKT